MLRALILRLTTSKTDQYTKSYPDFSKKLLFPPSICNIDRPDGTRFANLLCSFVAFCIGPGGPSGLKGTAKTAYRGIQVRYPPSLVTGRSNSDGQISTLVTEQLFRKSQNFHNSYWKILANLCQFFGIFDDFLVKISGSGVQILKIFVCGALKSLTKSL